MSPLPALFSRRPRRTRRAKGRAGRAWLPWILGLGACLVVAGIGALKWAETRRGQAALLAMGSQRMYGDVQATVEEALAPLLPGLHAGAAPAPDTARPGGDCDWPAPTLGAGAAVRCRTVVVDPDTPWWDLQHGIEQALAPVGGRILWGERLAGRRSPRGQVPAPDEQTDLLRLDVGVAARPTHTLVLMRAGRSPAKVAWGGSRERSAWQSLQERGGPVVALVIDDWGNNRSNAAGRILDLPVPLTMAILPGLSYSRHFALQRTDLVLPPDAPASDDGDLRRARRDAGCVVDVDVVIGTQPVSERRRETILHLPMQPESYPETNPGPRALMVGMDRDAVRARLDDALAGLPHVSGVNNHMGSAATADAGLMDALMQELSGRSLFFVDSMTSPRSVAYDRAVAAGVPAEQNRIFLDYDNEDPGRIAANLARLVRAARATGFAVGIGHPHGATADVLARDLPRYVGEGVRFVTVSELMALRQGAGSVAAHD